MKIYTGTVNISILFPMLLPDIYHSGFPTKRNPSESYRYEHYALTTNSSTSGLQAQLNSGSLTAPPVNQPCRHSREQCVSSTLKGKLVLSDILEKQQFKISRIHHFLMNENLLVEGGKRNIYSKVALKIVFLAAHGGGDTEPAKDI